jgi:SPP1 gp7 family putative phage head morphogenesis protein
MPRPGKRPHRPPNTRKVERYYARQLRRIARHVSDIVGAFPAGDPSVENVIRRALTDYSETITGWARMLAGQMVEQVSNQDEQAWRDRTREMAGWLRREIETAPTGQLMRALMDEQVTLIKSIPLEAAARVHEWTLRGQQDGTRAAEVAAEIRRTNEVTAARAMLIARTETARTASKLTEARSIHIGATQYIWRTSGDSDVRDSHREMNGQVCDWANPPTLSDGTTTHAGQIWNCRCYPEPIIPD